MEQTINWDNKKPKDKSKWVLVYTKPNQENKADINLQNQGFQTFLPKISHTQLDNRSVKIEVMFPRYIFVLVNELKSKWSAINSTKGVSQLIYFGQNIAHVPDYVIESIREQLDSRGILNLKIFEKEYIQGDKLFLKDGLFKGQEAIFLSRKSKDRVNVLLKLINNNVIADISSSEVGKKTIHPSIKF